MAVLWACLGLFAHNARAESCAVLLRIAEPLDEALLERVRGQTSDLSCPLQAQPTSPLEPTPDARLATARELAQSHEAQVVVWAERTASSLKLAVVDVSSGRVLVRELPLDARASARDRSAQEEAAALVVRSALKASLAGQPLGEPEPALSVLTEPEPAPIEAALTTPAERKSPRIHAVLALGMVGGADGASEHGHYGLGLRVAVERARVELGLRGSFGLSSPVASPLADVALAQHRAALYAGLRVLEREWLALSVISGAGLHVFTTTVASTRAGFVAADSRRVLASVSAGLRCELSWRGRYGVALTGLLEAFPRPLELGYQDSQGFARSTRAWPLQPTLSLELVLRP